MFNEITTLKELGMAWNAILMTEAGTAKYEMTKELAARTAELGFTAADVSTMALALLNNF